MKILLVNPEFPETYWSFRHALPFEGKRCVFPPLGLITVSSLLPRRLRTTPDRSGCRATEGFADRMGRHDLYHGHAGAEEIAARGC